MPTDIVLPDGNEKEFLQIAERLGFSKLIFAYPIKDIPIKTNPKIAAIIKSKKEAQQARSKAFMVMSETSEEVRESIEKIQPDIIYGIEGSRKKDFIHHRNSGMNHIIAKLAAENKVSLGFNFSYLISLPAESQAIIMGRMRQNVILARKYGIRIRAFTLAIFPYQMRGYADLVSLMLDLGMTPTEAKQAFSD